MDIDRSFDGEIVRFLGHRSLNAMVECEWLLTNEQISQLSSIIGHPLPMDLKLFIGVRPERHSHPVC
jgi:hypothetical protein